MTNKLGFISLYLAIKIIFGSCLLLAENIERTKTCNSTICQGLELYENGKEKEGLQLILKAAQAGDPDAQRIIGLAYLEGNHIEKNYQKAFTMFKRAAEQNDPGAQFELAIMYHDGEGIKQNRSKAIEYVKLSANQGHFNACKYLGIIYFEGTEIKQDFQQAYKYLKVAIEKLEDPEILYIIFFIYRDGLGVPKDRAKAFDYLKRAAAAGNPEAQKMLKQFL